MRIVLVSAPRAAAMPQRLPAATMSSKHKIRRAKNNYSSF
jgi:hypothetical protein